MSSSAITTQVAQLKAGNIQNQADSSSIYSAGVWSFKNSTAVASVTISDAGNVGIGTASPATKLDVNGGIRIPALSSLQMGNGSTYIYTDIAANGSFIVGTSSTERMRIDASGNVTIGPQGASTNVHRIVGTILNYSSMASPTNNGALSWANGGNSQSSPLQLQSFGDNSSVSIKAGESANTFAIINLVGNWNGSSSTGGKIDCIAGTGGVRLSAGGTSWGVISDERKKKNIKPLEYGLAEVSAIKPVRFDYIVDESDASSRIGFTAQNLMPLVKESVQGSEDTEFTVTPTEMIPVLVKAIQEQQAQIEEMKAKLAALEAKP